MRVTYGEVSYPSHPTIFPQQDAEAEVTSSYLKFGHTVINQYMRMMRADGKKLPGNSVEVPVTQNSTSKSRTRSYENLVDVVVSGNFWSILAWP